MKTVISAAALALALSSGAALAADLPSRKGPPPVYIAPAPVATWTGLYAGLNAGATFGSNSGTNFSSATLIPGLEILASQGFGRVPTNSDVAFIGGGQIGYNWQFANTWLVGLEADIQGVAGASRTNSAQTNFLAFPGNVNLLTTLTSRQSLDYLGTVRGRIGYLFTPTLLLYGTGGLAYGQVVGANTLTQVVVAPNGTAFPLGAGANSFSTTRVGWTAGGGLEWLFAPKWSAKIEYLYYDLGTANSTLGVATLAGVPYIGTQTSTRYDGHVVRAGLNYHFNWAPTAPVFAKY